MINEYALAFSYTRNHRIFGPTRMQHSFTISSDENLLSETFTGDIDMELIPAIDRAIMAKPGFKSGLKFLTDLTQARIAHAYQDLVKQGSLKPGFEVSKHAYVVANDHDFGMVRMMITISSENDNNNVNVFKCRDEAIAWLED